MIKIIEQINETLRLRKLSETKLAEMAGEPQKKVNNLLAGRTKRLDPKLIQKLTAVLGIVADTGEVYGVTTVHRSITPEEENLLKILESVPDIREAMEGMIALPERKRKIHLGRILEDLEKLEDEG